MALRLACNLSYKLPGDGFVNSNRKHPNILERKLSPYNRMNFPAITLASFK